MSTEQETVIETTDAAPPETVEVPVEEQNNEPPAQDNEEKKEFNPKTDKVEFTTPEQQERFNEVFRQMKKSDTRNQMLTDFLAEQQKQLDELRGFTKEIKTEKEQATREHAGSVLMGKLNAAREAGDDRAYDLALKDLIAFESTSHASKIFDQKVNEIYQKESVKEQDQASFVVKAMEERDETGDYRRPWLQENNENFGKALYEISRIAKKYEKDPDILGKTLSELDQVMGGAMTKKPEPPIQTRAPNPMQGSNLTNQKPKGTIKMTRAEQDILSKLQKHSGKKIDLKKYATRRDAMYDSMNKGGR